MKVIVTGATGFVGGEVVKQCISNPSITSILVISRRDLPKDLSQSSKVKVILHQDFSSWPSSILEQLEGAEGCIWAAGGKVPDFPDIETARKVSVDHTIAAANAFATSLAPRLESGRKFSFVFCSGQGAEREPDAKVWLFSDTRKIKGAVEKGLIGVAAAHASVLETYILRPGGVLPDNSRMAYVIGGAFVPVVYVSELARGLITACLTQPDKNTIENNEIVELGKRLSI